MCKLPSTSPPCIHQCGAWDTWDNCFPPTSCRPLHKPQRSADTQSGRNSVNTSSFPYIEVLQGWDGRDGRDGVPGPRGPHGQNGDQGVAGPPRNGSPFSAVQDHNVPCAVCYASTRVAITMILAKTQCPSTWIICEHTHWGWQCKTIVKCDVSLTTASWTQPSLKHQPQKYTGYRMNTILLRILSIWRIVSPIFKNVQICSILAVDINAKNASRFSPA